MTPFTRKKPRVCGWEELLDLALLLSAVVRTRAELLRRPTNGTRSTARASAGAWLCVCLRFSYLFLRAKGWTASPPIRSCRPWLVVGCCTAQVCQSTRV